MRNRKTSIFLVLLMLSALLVLWQVALAGPPLKPGNPGLPGYLAEVVAKEAEIANLQAQIDELKSQALVQKTGQTDCYDESGNPLVSCDGTGQDGEYQMGAMCPEPRFIDNEDGTITDNCTGLMWKQMHLGSMTWQDALNSCNSSEFADYEDWRLPNVKELQSLIDYGQDGPALPSGHPFINVQSDLYWTSTSVYDNPTEAWYQGMSSGDVTNGPKSHYGYVWPVRGGN